MILTVFENFYKFKEHYLPKTCSKNCKKKAVFEKIVEEGLRGNATLSDITVSYIYIVYIVAALP